MFSLLRSRSSAGQKKDTPDNVPTSNHDTAAPSAESPAPPAEPQSTLTPDNAATTPAPTADPASPIVPAVDSASPSKTNSNADGTAHQLEPTRPSAARRLSWRPFTKAPNGAANVKPPTDKPKAPKPAENDARPPLPRSRSEKQAQESALVLRELIVGPASKASGKVKTKVHSSAEVNKVRAQLARPKTAGKVIAQLRQLSSSDEPVVVGTGSNGETLTALYKGPIHAVCLPYPDAEAHERHFSKLAVDKAEGAQDTATGHVHDKTTEAELASVATASISSVKTVFSEVNLVSLITTPDLGLGGPPDGPGILSGALPSAQTIIQGVEQITPQLMALGYATGKAVLPDHAGIYPPTDRMSVITYWWGFELAMPQSSLHYLDNVPSVAHAVVNFLTALSVAEGGVREIMPFVRYISQFVDTEYNMIKHQDKGQGVVCAATWIMPVALVPRPWDFPRPPSKLEAAEASGPANDASSGQLPSSGAPAAPSLGPMSVPTTENGAAAETHEDLPEVKVTPPTPPASQTLKPGETAREGEADGGGEGNAQVQAPAIEHSNVAPPAL